MDPSNAPNVVSSAVIDADLIELEPTTTPRPASDPPSGLPSYSTRHSPRVALVERGPASLAGETGELLRHRVAAAALFLAVANLILLVWFVFTGEDVVHKFVWFALVVRLAISAGIAGLLIAAIPLTRRQVVAAELALFGSLTCILCVSQYVVDQEMLRLGNVPGVIAYIKNGVIQVFGLMVLYGMFIPNTPRNAARVVLTMALAPMITIAVLMEHPDVAETVHHLRSTEQVGSNALYLLIGAGLAIYGAHVLNGLRAELHESRKFGQYTLLDKLGSGGMGEVYLAEHQLLKRPCALKLIRPESGADPIALARFEREVQAAARLSHPNSIDIYDYGHTDDGTFYYVMEYLPGLSLDALVHGAGPLPAGRVIYILRQVCAALAEAHSLGLIHRDLKPANIFVARRGGESDVAKVLDFGLVKLTGDHSGAVLTQELTVSGTPAFMAPEQATASNDLDARADLYSLGAVAYYALTGRPPFSGQTPFAILMAHARDPVVPPSQIKPEIPSDLEQIVLTCLAKSPSDRYPDARSLAIALASCSSSTDWNSDKADAWWAENDGSIGPSARA